MSSIRPTVLPTSVRKYKGCPKCGYRYQEAHDCGNVPQARLRKRRIDMGMSQATLSRRSGVALRIIKRVELMESDCSVQPTTRRKWLKVLKVPVTDHEQYFGPTAGSRDWHRLKKIYADTDWRAKLRPEQLDPSSNPIS